MFKEWGLVYLDAKESNIHVPKQMKTGRIKEKFQFLRIFSLLKTVPIFKDKNKVYTADLLEKFEVEFFAVARYLIPKEHKKQGKILYKNL